MSVPLLHSFSTRGKVSAVKAQKIARGSKNTPSPRIKILGTTGGFQTQSITPTYQLHRLLGALHNTWDLDLDSKIGSTSQRSKTSKLQVLEIRNNQFHNQHMIRCQIKNDIISNKKCNGVH